MVLALALLASLVLVQWVSNLDQPADDIVPAVRADASKAPAEPDTGAGSRARAGKELDLSRLQRESRAAAESASDAFAKQSWYVPPPPPPPPPPAKPTAPALPFQFMGRVTLGEREFVILTKQDRNYTVSPGDTIEGTYRVEEIAARSLTLTYIPLGERQTLPIAEGG